jgi:hypothetical protein
LLLLTTAWLLIQSSAVQNWLIGKITNKWSKDIQAKISISHVDFSLFNKMLLQGVLLKDKKQDTLLYAGEIRVNITDWFFMEDKAVLKYISLDHVNINLSRKDSVWNYDFLADYFSSTKKTTDKKGIELDLKKLDLSHIVIHKIDEWRGENMYLNLNSFVMDADHIDFSKKQAFIHLIEFTQPQFAISTYDGRRPTPVDTVEVIRNDPKHLRWNPAGWDIFVENAVIDDGSFKNDKLTDLHPNDYFDGKHIYFNSINWNFKGLRLKRDTVTAQMNMSLKERSGFAVKKFTAQMKFFPEAMEFAKMDLQTGKSSLRNYFAMRFKSFDDLSDYLNKVKMEADFTDAHVDSDDISFFAPELKNWKKTIRITGNIKGTVSDLQGRKVVINTGRNTLLNGDIHLKGLPNIDQTFIEFNSNDFRTSYADLVTLIPGLQKMTQPRIDRIQWLRFKGNFNGYIHNFVTSGTIETNLGNLVSNVNMKLPANRPAVYSGTINADNFDLGQFLDNDNIGKLSFKGSVNGNGLTAKTLNATLDGKVSRLDFNDYTYQNLQVNGTITERKFNGQFVTNDSNLNAKLNGLIDFSLDEPKFDFNATVLNSNLKNLHFTKDDMAFNGKLRFNFTGNAIDNFLGSARIYDASIFRKDHRISFDSLTLESSMIDSNKKITVVSNEFAGAIVGEFSIKELPVAFQTFLNRYYPSYIKPVTELMPAKQNFSFVITTKKVDEYLDLFAKNLKGFNNSSITGRINSRDNLLDLNADIPQFTLGKIAFYDVKLKGRGNLDSLAMESNIGETYISDSLHFPSTHILLRSFNDLSDVQVTTSANQTLNSANISARVQTLNDGIHIKFNPTTFEINSKVWAIDRNGELSLGKGNISVEGLRIYNGEQQVLVSTSPSSEGSWNDLYIDLKKINIGDFAPYFVKDERFEGLLNGKTVITSPFDNPVIQFNGQADQFRLDNDSIGSLQLKADYTKKTGLVNAGAYSDNKDYHFNMDAVISTKDTANKQPVNIAFTNLTNTKIDLLQKWLGGIFSDISGYASGQLQIVGAAAQLKYLGKIQLRDARLKVNYTQCYYKIPSAVVDFKEDRIDFGSFQIKDTLGNTAELTTGKLYHHSFRDLGYDFAINTNRLLLLNTKVTDNSLFYGTMIGKVNISLKGPQENMKMEISGQPTDSSNIYLPTTTSRESSDADFIVWKEYGKEIKASTVDQKGTNLSVTLNISANNYANVYVIIDPLTKDIIKANGHGNLIIKTGTTEDMDIRGRYEIDQGNYNFTFQSVIHKPFVFSEGVSNYIQWTGNPYDADIGIQAIYKAENIQFSDLGISSSNLNNSTGIFLSHSSILPSFHGEVWVTATLSNKLMKPDISFQISLPPNSPVKNDPEAAGIFEKIQSDPNELNKQVAFLIVFNSFGPLTNSNSTYSANSAVGSIFVTSISGALSSILSKQFSNVFQKAFKDKSIRVNFNTSFYYASLEDNNTDLGGANYNRTNLNLSVIKSFLNEKLTFTFGSAFDFGLTTQQIQAASVQFLPNINAEWKITPNGRVVLNFFYRDSYNYLSLSANHTQNSSGTSISYRQDFDNIKELLKGKKKDKPVKPAPPLVTPVSSAALPAQGTVAN